MSNFIRAAINAPAQWSENHQNDAVFMGKGPKGAENWSLIGGSLKVQRGLKSTKYNVTECHAEYVDGGHRQRMTVTRIGAGALLAGPVGAVIGGMAKKDLSKSWVILVTPDGDRRIEVKGGQAAKAQEFVFKLEDEAARQEAAAQG